MHRSNSSARSATDKGTASEVVAWLHLLITYSATFGGQKPAVL